MTIGTKNATIFICIKSDIFINKLNLYIYLLQICKLFQIVKKYNLKIKISTITEDKSNYTVKFQAVRFLIIESQVETCKRKGWSNKLNISINL